MNNTFILFYSSKPLSQTCMNFSILKMVYYFTRKGLVRYSKYSVRQLTVFGWCLCKLVAGTQTTDVRSNV